ncbi:MAG: DNA mismatch repair protein MutS [Candidatus Omnitrophica bacterium]|nr:DNA mismatch repair protein MutS [Candidatus Omnitrophota bacterium]
MEHSTPMLKQYHDIKSRHKDAILFFRLGDFYEMFFDDAKHASSILDLVLTSRGQDASGKIPMCGIPYHSSDGYIAKLIKAGQKVAICEQVEDVAVAKGIVKRDVIRVISAGTYLDEETQARYLLSLYINKNGVSAKGGSASGGGFAFCNTAGGVIFSNEFPNTKAAIEMMARLPIYECVYPLSQHEDIQFLFNHPILKLRNIALSPLDDWHFHYDAAFKNLCTHFGVLNLNGFGFDGKQLAVASSGALLNYLQAANKTPLKHLNRMALYTTDDYVFISPAAHYGLELEEVLKALDLTQTSMGHRLFRFWLFHPLKNVSSIQERQEAVLLLNQNHKASNKLRECLQNMPDLEKALSRISCGCFSIKDILALRNGLLRSPLIAETISSLSHPLLNIHDLTALRELLTKTINPEVPLAKPEGKIINTGIDPELDELRGLQDNGRAWLANYQAEEIKRSGINSLKVGFNNVFGYYIEISKTHQKSAPASYIRKQTLANGERYITPELKEYEEKFLTAQNKILAIEKRILLQIEKAILEDVSAIHTYASQIAHLDCLLSLNALSQRPNYIFADVNDSLLLDIKDGRHPVVEKTVAENFIANDTLLDNKEQHLIILTGPNMAGKSTYIRQTAILVLMAQMGAPIPASSASIGLVDKIFTRIGAHDDISKNQSTFMVEMTEAADILNNLTERSLVILDEIGRGTSTSDGLSLAWALAEHLQKQKTRTLFATHFHELIALSERFSGLKNYNVAVKEWKDQIIFMHKITPGGCDDSYGIYVAKLAGIPEGVIRRSKEILSELELGATTPIKRHEKQIDLFTPTSHPELEELRSMLEAVDVNNITPLEALKILNEIKNKLP